MTEEYALGKILGTQELGYRKGVPRGGGPYIFISKKFIQLFPLLSNRIKNDRYFIDIVYNDKTTKAVIDKYYYYKKYDYKQITIMIKKRL